MTKCPGHFVRYQFKEEGMEYRYCGTDLIDLRPMDSIELVELEQLTYRSGVQRDNHLMVRFVVIIRDAASGEQVEETTSYANYHVIDGVATALQVARTRYGRRMLQAFYESCTYNPNLAPNFFTKAALEQRFQEVGSRADKKKAGKTRD